jgi:hypothetical protein
MDVNRRNSQYYSFLKSLTLKSPGPDPPSRIYNSKSTLDFKVYPKMKAVQFTSLYMYKIPRNFESKEVSILDIRIC